MSISLPTVLAAVRHFLRHATQVQLHLTQVISVEPGETKQKLHRDQMAFDFYPFPPDYHVQANTMWALSDFTDEVGATRVVVGSHLWDRSRTAQLQDSVPAVMPKGSVVIYLASCLHGSGPNRTLTDTRIGLNVDYNMALLKTGALHTNW